MSHSLLPAMLRGEINDSGMAEMVSTNPVEIHFNITSEILRIVVNALQRIHMKHVKTGFRLIRALPLAPTVSAEHVESFWMFCDVLQLTPYFAHKCVKCHPTDPAANVLSRLCFRD